VNSVKLNFKVVFLPSEIGRTIIGYNSSTGIMDHGRVRVSPNYYVYVVRLRVLAYAFISPHVDHHTPSTMP